MSKFNSSKPSRKAVNKAGHAAYSMQDKELLVTQVLTTFINEKKFYGDNTSELIEQVKKVSLIDPEFIAKLAVYARKEHNLRSVSHLLTAILANDVQGKQFVRRLIPAVTVRADDMTEILACYLSMFGKPLPNSIKKG